MKQQLMILHSIEAKPQNIVNGRQIASVHDNKIIKPEFRLIATVSKLAMCSAAGDRPFYSDPFSHTENMDEAY